MKQRFVFEGCQVVEGGVSSPALVVAFDPDECVLLDLGEIVQGRVWMSSFL
jgi:hypothetical protein